MPSSSGSDPRLTVEITARQLSSTPDQDSAHASAEGGRVKVEGSVTTPTPCYDLAGEASREGRTVTLTVEARRKEGGCIQMIAAFGYQAAVRGLPAGSYALVVRHAYPGVGWEGATVLETEIEVR
jgi:hypothetical protein